MKKFFFFLIFVVVVLALDGTLTKGIFSYGIHTVSGWLGLALTVGIVLALVWVESANKVHRDKNTRE